MSLAKSLVSHYCIGRGLEIGPGKNPYCNPSTTLFLDKFTDNNDATPRPDIISDASQVPKPDETFDYVLSSHVLEHMQDTIGTLKEWIRVLKKDGILFLLLPHADRMFDKHRSKTTLEHHILDHQNITSEPDHSHDQEIKEGWSKLWTTEEEKQKAFAEYKAQWGADVWDFDFRIKNGVIHFHVWTQDEIVKLLTYMGLKILWTTEFVPERNDTFIVIAKK
jgi:predicted SAM-dependent methyltransferase